MDPQHINPKNLSHRSDVTVWNGIAYVAGIIPPDNSLSIVQTAEALPSTDTWRRPAPTSHACWPR